MKAVGLMDTISSYVQQLETRERRMLLLGVASIVAALLYFVGIDPAWSGKKQLQKAIPQLKQQVAEMDVLSKQSAQLGTVMAENVDAVSREMVELSLSRRGLKAQNLSVSDDIVRLQISAAAYPSLMEWLLEVQKSSRLTVEESKLTALAESGQVSAVLTMKQQKNTL
ncbi:type II secretion system protein M [Undibacterium sp. Jales W-56]|uniref:type II secretion system protein M n=1 Tax=Undibacterium sp. Jales W-56 TaxID=2897325 RepID=UPI0021D26295|nr:type II secretion system protein M [Undibacterium sp. Jales W-56]MCU6433144.1 type II secretion system protein M [Undibacterium sp. Jales W-56]